MFNRKTVHKALKRTLKSDDCPGCSTNKPADDQSSMTSQLIYDVFGGKILKIFGKRGWHFYNRIDGEQIDFTVSEMGNRKDDNLEGLPSTPEETRKYFAAEDYLTFYMRFISSFEEIVGLRKYRGREMA